MRSRYVAALLVTLAGPALAQATGDGRTDTRPALPPVNQPGTLPEPGGGVSAGPGAPSSATQLDRTTVPVGPAVRSGNTVTVPLATAPTDPGRGAPAPGSATPSPLGSSTGGSSITSGGAIRPGSTPGGEGTGGNTGGSGSGSGGGG